MFVDSPPRVREIDRLEAEVATVCGHLHAQHGRLVALTAEALEARLWEQPGIRSPEHWLCWKTGLSSAHARAVVAAARRFHELPATMSALEAGEVSLDQIGPIVTRAPGSVDDQVCELAKHCTVSQIRAAVGRYPFPETDPGPLPDAATAPLPHGDARRGHPAPDAPATPPQAPPDREFASMVQHEDGTWRLTASFDADHGLVFEAALREVTDRLFRETGRLPNGVEVLIELAHCSLSNVADSTRRDRYRVHVLLEEQHQLVDPLGYCLPPWIRDLITCDADMAVTWTRHGTPIAQGSTAPEIPAAVRRHVLARDHHCRVPGCGTRRRLDLHHVIHRAHGGTNDPSNLAALCPHHHRRHHRGDLGISGDADTTDGLVFTNRQGRPLSPNTLIRPPECAPPPPTGQWKHPLGERLQLEWVYFHVPQPSTPPASAA
jgi:hypothetical protein